MIESVLTVENKTGLHMRPVAQIIKLLSAYKSKVVFQMADKRVEGKSPLSFMKLGAKYGDKISVVIEGEDEEEVFGKLKELFENKFGENE